MAAGRGPVLLYTIVLQDSEPDLLVFNVVRVFYPVLCLYTIVQQINMFEYFLASIQVTGFPFASLPLGMRKPPAGSLTMDSIIRGHSLSGVAVLVWVFSLFIREPGVIPMQGPWFLEGVWDIVSPPDQC